MTAVAITLRDVVDGTGICDVFTCSTLVFLKLTVTNTIATGLSISTLHIVTGIIHTLAVHTGAAELALFAFAIIGTSVFDTLASFADLAFLTTHVCTGVLNTLAIAADLAGSTGRAGFDTLAVGGATELIHTAVTVGTEVVDALSVFAIAAVCTGDSVTGRSLTLTVDTDTGVGTVTVGFTGQSSLALAVFTLLTVGTFDASTGISHTTIAFANTSVATGKGSTLVFDTGAVDAGFTVVALDVRADIASTTTIDADFTSCTVNTSAGVDTFASTTEFAFVTGRCFAGVNLALTVDTEFVALTIAVFATGGSFTIVVDAEFAAGTVFVENTIRR